MSTVPNAPTKGHPSDPTLSPTPTPVPREWFAAARSHAEDLVAAALDATSPPAARNLGRRAARRIVRDAAGALRHLLDTAGAPSVAEADRTFPTAAPSAARSRDDHPIAPSQPPPDDHDDDADATRDAAARDDQAREARVHEAQAQTVRRTQEQSAELRGLRDARPNCPGEVYRFPLVGALLYGMSADDQDPLSGVLRALLGDVSALAVLAGEQDPWAQLTPTLEGIERRVEVALDLRRRENESQRAA